MNIVSFIVTTLFVCLGILHFYWVLDGKSGLDKAYPGTGRQACYEARRNNYSNGGYSFAGFRNYRLFTWA